MSETLTIYHNPRCRKSREALALLEAKNISHNIVLYLESGLSVEIIKNLLQKLNLKPIELVRKNEDIWKTIFKNKALTDREIIDALCTHPKLMERPVIVSNQTAVVGRPIEALEKFILKL